MSDDLVGWARATAIEQRKDFLLRSALCELKNVRDDDWDDEEIELLIEDIKEALDA